MSSQLTTLDLATLSTTTGGAAQAPQQEGPPQRAWGQAAREYGAACVTGAGQALMFGGRPRSWQQAAGTAAVGCATGVGMRAIDDLSGRIAGNGEQ